ncbi:ABC transporter ATP-binding protein [Enterocloster bolteae]|jgi:ABC-type polysaccharide/polyol phosphate transport system ATPase subunit|uniref:ABC transporter ATP-binding protein n=1 Tax=Enterocloster bolteae TaxID=208479 RepID=UPI0029003956|nr:ABC transporter ATP-binding protein [Enterocloster bolteae]MDU1138088.1 ABC transporter ATP-binding protein [Enterocloster bolteae]
MKAENAIEVHDIKKSFRVYLDKGRTLKELVLFSKRRKYEERQVLQGISFEVKKGEALGLIGHNGCGKSTTLKLLTRIMYPDSGTIEMRGRVSSLIELGAGFHPDMSGRQNIYTNASIFGLTRKEIDARVDNIIEFSELEAFIDNPVRTYSSGMYMRLAFAVAINVDADILLVDEILAVGDANFQAKCFNKLREIKANGTTIVIVSHSLGQIEEICERSIWIHEGKIQKEGNPREVHPAYLEYMGQKRPEAALEKVKSEGERPGDGRVRIKTVEVILGKEGESNVFRTGEPVTLGIAYNVIERVEEASIGLEVYNGNGVKCYSTDTRTEKMDYIRLEKDGEIHLILENLELLNGKYTMDFSIKSKDNFPIDSYAKAFSFEMYSDVKDTGISRLAHKWDIRNA